MFLVLKKKTIYYGVYICCRLKSQYFGAPKSGAPKMRGLPTVAGIAGDVPTPLVLCVYQAPSEGWVSSITK